MKTETVNGKMYIVTESNTYYSEGTRNDVIDILERARYRGQRIKLFYGDIKTGRNWNEEHYTVGTIGKSTGTVKIPLLIATKRSMGGGAILTDCIIAIKEGKNVLYKAANFKEDVYTIAPSDMQGYEANTLINGELYGRHKTEASAKRLINKLKL
jgi:hypothetical protein